MDKLIITIAPTGNVPTKDLTPHAALTTEEIVADLEKCEKLGASIAHIHVRDDRLQPTSDRNRFSQVLQAMEHRGLKLIRQLSTGARGGENSIAWRGQMLDLPVEMASLATGSSNFPNSVNANSPELIRALALKMQENGIKPEIEAFDVAMIENTRYLIKQGILTPPLHFNLVMNVPGSIKGSARNLLFMVESLPKGSSWTVTAIGKVHITLITMAIALGGHVRTGLEDVIQNQDGNLVSNESLVRQVIAIAQAVGRDIASIDEARNILQL